MQPQPGQAVREKGARHLAQAVGFENARLVQQLAGEHGRQADHPEPGDEHEIVLPPQPNEHGEARQQQAPFLQVSCACWSQPVDPNSPVVLELGERRIGAPRKHQHPKTQRRQAVGQALGLRFAAADHRVIGFR